LSKHGFFQITQKVFLKHNQRLLVLRDRKSGHGDLPGGRMTEDEFFEDWTKSVHRELEEELGKARIDLQPEPIFIHKHRVNEGNHPCLIIAYRAELKSPEIVLSDEHDFMDWVDPKSFDPRNLFSEYMLEAFLRYQQYYA